MRELIVVLVIAAMISGCREVRNEPPQAKAWCQYNAFENRVNRENFEQWDAAHPNKSVPQSDLERMMSELRPKLKAERDKLFDPLSDVDFGVLQLRAIEEDWYQSYCNH